MDATEAQLQPAGCTDLKEALSRLEDEMNEEALKELDLRMEAMLKKHFTALVNVCLDGGSVVKNLQTAMRRTAEEFVADRLGQINVMEMFLERHADDKQAATALADCFDKAAPQLSPSVVCPPLGGPFAEFCVLAAPSDQAGERLRALAAKALPNIEWQPAFSEEDILIYREQTNQSLSDLPQLGPLAEDAYRQMNSAEHFTPHCRCDVDFSSSE